MQRMVLIAVGAVALFAPSPHVTEPGGTPEAARMALTQPDEHAWQLFLYLNRQAATGTAGAVDETKNSLKDYDDDRDVVWETWALSSGLDLTAGGPGQPLQIVTNKSEVFKNPATEPVVWEKLNRATPQPKVLSPNFKTLAAALGSVPSRMMGGPAVASAGFQIVIAPPGTNPAEDESRMNRSTYETVRTQRLYSVEGLDAAIARAGASGLSSLVKFDQMSKEVKARWKHLAACDADASCPEKKRYHWRTVTVGGARQIWGLVSLHIITKDLPNWMWADFGHIDCENQRGACSDEGESALTPLRDSTTGTPSGTQGPSGSNGVRNETRGSKWENYRLRGTEIDFTSATGVDSILSNPVIESGFQRSSCMTCHSYASSGLSSAVASKRGTSLPIFAGLKGAKNAGSQSNDVGRPLCQRFYAENTGGVPAVNCPDAAVASPRLPVYFQTDFLWSIPFRAFSEKP